MIEMKLRGFVPTNKEWAYSADFGAGALGLALFFSEVDCGKIDPDTVGLVSDVPEENGGFVCQGQKATLSISYQVDDHPDLPDRTETDDIEGEIVWVDNGLYLEAEDGNHYPVAEFDNWVWTSIDKEPTIHDGDGESD